MVLSWLNPAGGLRYHVRALTSGGRWAPFQRALGMWLGELKLSSTRAVLVGPSAGYSFPDAFLQQFTAITVLEPDPIAAALLSRRLRRLGIAELRFESRDWLLSPLLTGSVGLVELLEADPALCLIFGNVLGQARFLLGDVPFERFKAAFRERVWPLLASRAWLAFHDRFSGKLAPRFHMPYRAPVRLSDEAVLNELYANTATGELFDHQSEGFFPSEHPHSYFSWQIDRERVHLIEGVCASAQLLTRA